MHSWLPQMDLNDQSTLKLLERLWWILQPAYTDTSAHTETTDEFHGGNATKLTNITGQNKQNPTHRAETRHSSSSKSLAGFYTLKFSVSRRTELVPLINSSAFHRSDKRCNLCSKKPKSSVMERGRRRCITQVVMAGDSFLRPRQGIMSLQGAEKHFFQQPYSGSHSIFVSPRETLCVHSHVFSLHRHAHEEHCWHCQGTPSPLCPSRHISAVLSQ